LHDLHSNAIKTYIPYEHKTKINETLTFSAAPETHFESIPMLGGANSTFACGLDHSGSQPFIYGSLEGEVCRLCKHIGFMVNTVASDYISQ